MSWDPQVAETYPLRAPIDLFFRLLFEKARSFCTCIEEEPRVLLLHMHRKNTLSLFPHMLGHPTGWQSKVISYWREFPFSIMLNPRNTPFPGPIFLYHVTHLLNHVISFLQLCMPLVAIWAFTVGLRPGLPFMRISPKYGMRKRTCWKFLLSVRWTGMVPIGQNRRTEVFK